MSGEDVLCALRAGDERAFATFVRAHHVELVRFALVRARDRATAEEVVQESWLVFLERLDAFEGRSSVRTFLFGILINVLRARMRKDGRAVPFSTLDDPIVDVERFAPSGTWPGHWKEAPPPWPSAEDAASAAELREALAQAIEALPDVHREVITLRDVLGWDPADICEVLGLSEGNLRVVLHRARGRVRAAIEARFAP